MYNASPKIVCPTTLQVVNPLRLFSLHNQTPDQLREGAVHLDSKGLPCISGTGAKRTFLLKFLTYLAAIRRFLTATNVLRVLPADFSASFHVGMSSSPCSATPLPPAPLKPPDKFPTLMLADVTYVSVACESCDPGSASICSNTWCSHARAHVTARLA